MKKYDYIVCYDIAHPKRLARLARFLEKRLVRIQYSIFIAKSHSKEQIYQLAQQIVEHIDPDEDDVRIYRILDYGISLGQAYDLDKVFIIV